MLECYLQTIWELAESARPVREKIALFQSAGKLQQVFSAETVY